MKLFKNPVFAVLLCLVIVLGSTCLSAGGKMKSRHQKLCDELCEEVLSFADKNSLPALKTPAQATFVSGDCEALIGAYQDALGESRKFKDADDVDEAIRDYNLFLRKTQRFPASFFLDLLNIRF